MRKVDIQVIGEQTLFLFQGWNPHIYPHQPVIRAREGEDVNQIEEWILFQRPKNSGPSMLLIALILTIPFYLVRTRSRIITLSPGLVVYRVTSLLFNRSILVFLARSGLIVADLILALL